MFDPWLVCSRRAVETLSENIAAGWEYVIDPHRLRTIRQADRENRDMVIRTVVANLALAVASGHPEPRIGVSLRTAKQRTSRYDRRGFRGLPNILEAMASPAGGHLLTLTLSRTKGLASTIVPSASLMATFARFRLDPTDFGQAPGQESIILNRSVPNEEAPWQPTPKERVDYADPGDHLTGRFRQDMATINASLSAAPLGFKDDGGEPVVVGDRAMRRVFNLPQDAPEGTERFDLGGRLWGGWWPNLAKDRRRSIRIAGEPVADLDFASMYLRLAYVEAGLVPPLGGHDLYAAIPGLTEACWRPGVKKAVSAMLFRDSPLTRVPRGCRAALPTSITGPQLRSAILAAHPALGCVFESGIGLRLMFVESQILVAALLALAREGIPALPMHDGLMVAVSKADTAERIMGDEAQAITGHRLPTHCKRL